MRTSRCIIALIAIAAAVTIADSAQADSLDPPAAQVSFLVSGQWTTFNPTLPLTSTPVVYTLSGSGLSASGGVSGGTDPGVTAGFTNSGVSAYAESNLTYEFEVNGPVNQIVQVGLSGSGGASSGSASVIATSSLELTDGINGPIFSTQACAGDVICVGSTGDSFSVDQTFSLYTDTAYLIAMGVSVDGAGGSGSAFVDPTVTLDTANPAYSLEFSPGLGTTSATPEPSSILLLVTGLLGSVFVVKGRKLAPRF